MPTYNKLVRDKIPEIIERKGGTYKIEKLDEVKYIQELKAKLKEELTEYLKSGNDVDAAMELADILEVMHSLSIIHGRTIEDIEAIRKQKYIERGGFEGQIYLFEAEDN
ncbi:nucleoside triphosphate pyrophosphohydrolase [Oceanobacillus kimchii]|uniref:Phosphoribosyl-ATP pyrophosphohydrolase n=1 Tax=Oceanobacillus kimchii TaxID=746691 RepID=A0ABQ5TQV2_9BACI|nr:nucleoside triphosphate pyrophosphohydrolase [Oceanobacillus kimchii]GLO68083.1 hypothetical protein MACH08_38670 [Oceanobacillus kimchii]